MKVVSRRIRAVTCEVPCGVTIIPITYLCIAWMTI